MLCKKSDVEYPFEIYAGIGPLGKAQNSLYNYSGFDQHKIAKQRTQLNSSRCHRRYNIKASNSKILRSVSLEKGTRYIMHSSPTKQVWINTKIKDKKNSLLPKSFCNSRAHYRHDTFAKSKGKMINSVVCNKGFINIFQKNILTKRSIALDNSKNATKRYMMGTMDAYAINYIRKVDNFSNKKFHEHKMKSVFDNKDQSMETYSQQENKLFKSDSPKDLLILAKEVTDKAKTLKKSDPNTICFYPENNVVVIVEDNGIIYKGEAMNGQRHGIGIEIYPDKRIYKGKWKNNIPCGRGIYQTNFGFTVLGEFNSDLNIVSTEAKFFVLLLLTNSILMAKYILAKYRISSVMDMECIIILQAISMKGSGLLINVMEKVYLFSFLGRIIFFNGGTFEGEFKNDEANGTGTFVDKWSNTFKVTESLRGFFIKGELFGEGKAILKTGDEYYGKFKCGKFNGHGRIDYNSFAGVKEKDKNYLSYEGDWVNNLRSGKGIMKWSDNSIFEGEWSEDVRVYGKLELPNDIVYEGQWKNGLFDGKGKLTLKSGNTIYCYFSEAKMANPAKIVYKNKSVYTGPIKYFIIMNSNFIKEGKGRLIDPIHGKYYGYFINDSKNGIGIFEYSNNDVYVGNFVDNKRCGHGQLYDDKTRTLYEGEWELDKRKGEGILKLENGRQIKGVLKNNDIFVPNSNLPNN